MSGIKHIDFVNRSILYIDLEGSASDFELIDIGQKAKKLVKLGSRTEVLVLYNLTGVVFTRNLMLHLRDLMEYSDLVSRRVMFGTDPAYSELLRQTLQCLGLAPHTRFAENYMRALQVITNDEEWRDRRQSASQAWPGPERRHNPSGTPTEADLHQAISRFPPAGTA